MRVLDLFSGIGGFSLGLERAGMKTIAFCEIDKFCQKVLKKHWPDVPIHNDITKLDGKQYAGAIDLICGGFPCQPFSVAGKQKGKDDNRYLWPEMLRIVSEAKPSWFIGENVPGIINLALEQVCVDLEKQGYEVQTLIIPACAVDALHRRNRIWIIAHSQHNGWDATKKHRGNGKNVYGSTKRPDITQQSEGIYSSTLMADTNSTRCKKLNPSCITEGARLSSWASSYIEYDGNIKPTICRDDNGLSGRVDRLKSLGNAVVPQIPEIIGRLLMQLKEPK